LAALAALLSCQNTTIVEDDPPPQTGGEHDVQFSVADSSSLPDSLWYRSPLDSGTHSFYVVPRGPGVRFLPVLHILDDRDTLSIHIFRLDLHLGMIQAVNRDYMTLRGVRTVRTASDSLAWSIFRAYDSLRKASPADFQDTSAIGMREAFQKLVAKLVFQGHPATLGYRKLAPLGLDTAKINRQILTLAASSGQTLGEIVRRWSLPLDYATATSVFKTLGLDSASLNPFRLETALALDTLHLGESPAGLTGKIRGKKGSQSVKFAIESDSGDRTDRFVLADLPDPKSHPEVLDFAGHPTIQPRTGAVQGKYTLRVKVTDSLSNEQTYSTTFMVAGALDHSGPSLAVLSPANSVVRDFNDSQLVVKVEAKDGSGVQWVKIGGAEAKKGSDDTWTLEMVVPVSATSVAVGIQAKDGAGNTSDAQISIRRNEAPKPTAPRLILVGPSNGTLVPFDSTGVWVEWKAETDFGKIEAVTINGLAALLEGGIWRARVSLSPDGKLVNLPVRAQSSVGLSVTEFVSVGRKADSAGPVVRWNVPTQDHRVAYDVKTLEVKVGAADPSAVDSVRIAGKKPDTAGGLWVATVDLANPGEITRIHVKAWDHLGNATDSVLLVSRDPIPGQLPPSLSWKSPEKASGTTVPFAQDKFLVQVVLTDISGIDASSVEINGVVAKAVNDSVWELSVDLPPNGQAQTITVVAKNKRGVSVSGFRSVARAKDEEKPTSTRVAGTQDRSVVFDTVSVEVGWTAKDNDRIAQAWIQDSLVNADASGYHRRVALGLGTQWIKFRAVDPAGNEVRDSVNVERRMDTVKAVTFSDTNGKLRSGSFWVKLSCATPGATIRYTLDGSEPKSTSPIYGDSLKIDTTITLKARGFATSRVDGPVGSQGYQLAVPVKVAGGAAHALVLLSDGSLWGFGSNVRGELGSEKPFFVDSPMKIADSVESIAAGNNVSMWVKTDNTLWVLGSNDSGALGDGSLEDQGAPVQIMRGVAKVVATVDRSTLILKLDGTLLGVGSNELGQLGIGTRKSIRIPAIIASDVVEMGGGWGHNQFLTKDGSLWSMGVPANGRLGDGREGLPGDDSCRTRPYKIMEKVKILAPGYGDANLVGREDGSLWCFGWGITGKMGTGNTSDVLVPTQVPLQGKVKQISIGGGHSIVLTEDGIAWGAGQNNFDQLDQLPAPQYSMKQLATGISAVATGDLSTYLIDVSGAMWSMGSNRFGQLGIGSNDQTVKKSRVRF